MNPEPLRYAAKAQATELLRQAEGRRSVARLGSRQGLRAARRHSARRSSEPTRTHVRSEFGRSYALWPVAFAFVVLLAFSTAPSPIYVLYAHRDHFSSLVITLIYAAYALGVVCTLFFVSHLSDRQGRRPHLLMAIAIAVLAAALFIACPSLPGLFAARILSGASVGLTVSTATAYLSELHRARHPESSVRRPQLTAAAANLGGLGLGALAAGLLAQYTTHPLVLPYLLLIVMLLLAGIAVALSPETRDPQGPPPPYRPQRVSAPGDARPQFLAALLGVFLATRGPRPSSAWPGPFSPQPCMTAPGRPPASRSSSFSPSAWASSR